MQYRVEKALEIRKMWRSQNVTILIRNRLLVTLTVTLRPFIRNKISRDLHKTLPIQDVSLTYKRYKNLGRVFFNTPLF